MTSLLKPESSLTLLAKFHDKLGWDSFIEGRVCKLWLEVREKDIQTSNVRTTAEFWARGLIRRLLELTHQQWLYRNAVVHYKSSDGLTKKNMMQSWNELRV